MNIWRLTFERPFSLTKLSLLRFNAITAHTRARQKRRLEFAGFVRDTHGVETRTVSIERLTVRLGAAQSQGVASFGLFVLPVTRCHCDRRCAHVVSHMGSWARTGRKGSFFFYKTQIVTRSQIKYCCLWKKNELKIRAISILVKKKRSLIQGENRESFFSDRALPTTAFSSVFFPPFSAQFSKVKGWLLSVLKSRSSECKNYF